MHHGSPHPSPAGARRTRAAVSGYASGRSGRFVAAHGRSLHQQTAAHALQTNFSKSAPCLASLEELDGVLWGHLPCRPPGIGTAMRQYYQDILFNRVTAIFDDKDAETVISVSSWTRRSWQFRTRVR
jgi:hypothetical protein